MGVRKNPSVARGPKLIMEMRQPHTTITSGVRQAIVEALETDGNEMAMTASPCESKNDRRTECSQLTAGSGGNAKRNSDRGLIATTISLAETFLPGRCLYGLAPSSPNETCESLPPPMHGSQSGRGWKLADAGVIWRFARIEDNPRFDAGNAGCGRTFSSPGYAQ